MLRIGISQLGPYQPSACVSTDTLRPPKPGRRSTRPAQPALAQRAGAAEWRKENVQLTRGRRMMLFSRHLHDSRAFMKNDACKGIELAAPRGLIEDLQGVRIAGVPALHDAGGAEIDVPGVALAVELRRQQPHYMHARRTAV